MAVNDSGVVTWVTRAALVGGACTPPCNQSKCPGGGSPRSQSHCPEGDPPRPITAVTSIRGEPAAIGQGLQGGGPGTPVCPPCPSPKQGAQPIRRCTSALRGADATPCTSYDAHRHCVGRR